MTAHLAEAAAEAAHAHAAAVDKTVEGHGLALRTGSDGVAAALHQSLGADDNGAVALLGLEARENVPAFIGDGDGAAGRLRGGEVQQNAALGGTGTEVLGHTGRAHGDDRAAGDAGLKAIVQRAVSAVGGAGDIDEAAAHGEIPVGVEPVTVGVDDQCAAGDGQRGVAVAVEGAAAHSAAEAAAEAVAAEGAHGVGAVVAAGRVQTVVAGADGDLPAADVDDLGFQTLIALGDPDRAAGDRQRVVGVDAVVAGGEREGAAAHAYGAVGVDGVVAGAHVQAAAGDGNIGVGLDALALPAVARVQNEAAAFNQDRAAGVQTVLLAEQVQLAARDGDRALVAVILVGGIEGVGAYVGVEDAALDGDAVLADKALAGGLEVHGAALELQIVLADHGVTLQGADV